MADTLTVGDWYDCPGNRGMRDKLLAVHAETVDVVTSQGDRRLLNRRIWETESVRAKEQAPYTPPRQHPWRRHAAAQGEKRLATKRPTVPQGTEPRRRKKK